MASTWFARYEFASSGSGGQPDERRTAGSVGFGKLKREHLQRQIAQHGLDMHHVTDRTGSPQTLVCRKTRENYRRQCGQHAEDIAAMRALQALAVAARDADRARLAAAVGRQPQAVEG